MKEQLILRELSRKLGVKKQEIVKRVEEIMKEVEEMERKVKRG